MPYKKYLKEREYYENLYDEFTVKYCRRAEKHFRNKYPNLKIKEFQIIEYRLWAECQLEEKLDDTKSDIVAVQSDIIKLGVGMLMFSGGRYWEKNKVIEEWIERDRKKDEERAFLWDKYQQKKKRMKSSYARNVLNVPIKIISL